MKNDNSLKWKFDVSTIRLLGRDLITDRITALFELVKNSYDANATEVNIEFINVSKRSENSKIIIKDNGIGMNIADISNKWMVIGTNSKRAELYTPEPFKRRYVGEKGVGRFAVDKLGHALKIRTKKIDEDKELVVSINWNLYDSLAEEQPGQIKLFTDVENYYDWATPSFEQGTILEILLPREIWSLDDIDRSYKELSRLVSPFQDAKYAFGINIKCGDFDPYSMGKFVKNTEYEFASNGFVLDYYLDTNEQEYLQFDEQKKAVIVKRGEKRSFGFIKFYLYYFDADAKNRFNNYHRGTSVHIDGIKIYRDGILTTPFAEYEAEDEKRRDILGINKRRWRATFDRMGTRDCVGYIEITREGNPGIVDSTNRQSFLGTKEFSDLQEFVYEQLDEVMKIRQIERSEKTNERIDSFVSTRNLVADLRKDLKKLSKAGSEKKQDEIISIISQKLPAMEQGLSAVALEYKESKIEEERKEKMYFSLMSLSMFAANISHAVRTTIFSIKDDAFFIQKKVEDASLKVKIDRINREINRLLKFVDFMLKYAKTDLPSDYFSVDDVIRSVFDAHETILYQKNIEVELLLQSNLKLHGNEIFFQDVITNLISNSIKAIEGNFAKKISCHTSASEKEITLLFSDNGIGIPRNKWDWVFGMYNTTTQEQGGAGIGLYVVKTNVESLGGQVRVEENNKFETGATIKIIIPFKK